MHRWGWAARISEGDVSAAVVAIAKQRGLVVSEITKKPAVFVTIMPASTDGRVLVLGNGIAGDEVARDLSRHFYRTEALDDLVAICLRFDDGVPPGAVELAFGSAGSARVSALLDAVRAGAQWERTVVGGRRAIKVQDQNGTRISVLDDAEMEQFEDGLRK